MFSCFNDKESSYYDKRLQLERKDCWNKKDSSRLENRGKVCNPYMGADIHRMDLSSMVMLKDNHLNWMKSTFTTLEETIAKIKKCAGFTVKIQVEVSNLEDALNAAKS